MEKTFKTKFEYCHIFDNKIVFTRIPEIKDLIADYAKSINDFHKTLMVFLIFIPSFAFLSVTMYYDSKLGISLYAGAIALFFLIFSFYIILFTSGSPVIKRDSIIKIKFKKRLRSYNSIQIKYKDFGRVKTRGFVVENNQINNVLDILKDEGLIKENDIDFNYGKVRTYSLIVTMVLIFFLMQFFSNAFFDFLPKTERSSAVFGSFFLILSIALLSAITQRTIGFFVRKKTSQHIKDYHRTNKPLVE